MRFVDALQLRYLQSNNREHVDSRLTGITMESPSSSFWARREADAALGKDNGLKPFSTKVFYAAVSDVLLMKHKCSLDLHECEI